MRNWLYRILAFVCVVILVICLCAPCFAVGAAMTAAEIFGSMWSTYASSIGLAQSFKTAGTLNNSQTPFSSAEWGDDMTSLFNDYQSYVSGNTTLAQFVADKLDDISVTAAPGVKTVFRLSSDLVEFFDSFTTWILEYKLNLTKDASGHFNTSGTWYSNVLAYNSPSNLYLPTVDTKPNAAYLVEHGLRVTTDNWYAMASSNNNSPVLMCIVNGTIYAFSTVNNSIYWVGTSSSSVISNNTTQFATSVPGVYYFLNLSNRTAAPGILTFDSVDAAAQFYANYQVSDGSSIQLRPKDKYNEGTNAGVLGIPDITDSEYVPKEMTGELDLPYDQSLTAADALTAALEWVKSQVLANEDILSNNVPVSPVIPPYVPFDLPSFNFNFSGIWYYVINWVGSLGSGFGMIQAVWSALPAAMVLPIYATAVVCIVVGVFRKVF